MMLDLEKSEKREGGREKRWTALPFSLLSSPFPAQALQFS